MESIDPYPLYLKRGSRVCTIPNCGTKVWARGLCNKHYAQWRKATPPEKRLVTPEDLFWWKVDRNGPTPLHNSELGQCWVWTRATTKWGYGKLTVNKRWYTAHSLSYEIANGPLPAGKFVCHRCDNPPCVRPSHLYLGTPKDNNHDMRAKGRAPELGPQGESNSNAKLTDEQVIAIRERFAQGELIRHLAPEYGVGVSSVSSIVNGRRWKHLGGPIRIPGQIGRRPRKAA